MNEWIRRILNEFTNVSKPIYIKGLKDKICEVSAKICIYKYCDSIRK
jgi:hypothetical protein